MIEYRIRIFSIFAETGDCKPQLEKLCETQLIPDYGINKKYYMTNGDDYTHAIIINTAMPQLKPDIPRENVIGFAWEPRPFLNLTFSFIEYAMKYLYNYYIGDANGLPYPFIEKNAHLLYNTPPRTISQKRNIMSIMVSFKGFAPGHNYRHTLVEQILKQNLPVDIYGNGCDRYSALNDSRIKGKFKLNEPYESYLFHIAIENFQTNEYFSEKIVNPLFHDTNPLYLGANNIGKYFNNMYISLVGNVEHDIHTIKDVLRNPEYFRKRHPINRQQIENTMNLFKNNNVERVFTI